jgi:hypothetical protein
MGQGTQLLKKLPFAPIIGALFGLVTAILIFDTPQWLFERLVASTGLPDLLPAAKPPLGQTARILTAIALGLIVAAGLGALLHFMERWFARKPKTRGVRGRGVRIEPVVTDRNSRRNRAPIFAETELGAPFMSDEAMEVARSELVLEASAETAEPVDIVEAPAVALEDATTLLAPAIEPSQAVSEVAAPPTPEPVPAHRAGSATAGEDDASIAGLLDRLETALERRQARNISGSPIPAGDIAALRKALGVAR